MQSSIQEGGPLYLFREFSSDGVNWSDRENVCRVSNGIAVSNMVQQQTLYHLVYTT